MGEALQTSAWRASFPAADSLDPARLAAAKDLKIKQLAQHRRVVGPWSMFNVECKAIEARYEEQRADLALVLPQVPFVIQARAAGECQRLVTGFLPALVRIGHALAAT